MDSENDKIRVVHVVTRMNTGGVAVLITEILKAYDRKKFELFLITGSCSSGEEDYLLTHHAGFNVIRVKNMSRSPNLIKDVLALAQISKHLISLKPNIVHTHTSKAGLIGRIAAKVTCPRAHIIHTYHGHLLQGYFSKFSTRLIVLIEKALGKITDVFISMGTLVMKELLEVGVGKIHQFRVLLPGISELPNAISSHGIEEFKCAHEGELICTFVGRISPIKRIDRVIEIARITQLKGARIHFLIIGDGDLRKELELKSSGLPVSFLGWQKQTQDWLAISHLAILLSDNEAVPLAMIEAGFSGLPTVATNVGSMSDVVIDGVNGLLVSTDVNEIADAVLRLANDPNLREAMGHAGQLLAREKFSTSAMVKAHEEIYSQIMQTTF